MATQLVALGKPHQMQLPGHMPDAQGKAARFVAMQSPFMRRRSEPILTGTSPASARWIFLFKVSRLANIDLLVRCAR
ncbi:hypothetical protein QBD00_003525 [Ochrobactrum sp. AN78]|nr:hypothetical protein [Ochrobactrum sp. AN78]